MPKLIRDRWSDAWLKRVATRRPETGCWLWNGCLSGGYGQLSLRGVTTYAHHASYEHFNGPRGDLQVLHRCDTPACINPDHLFLGTNLDNRLDSVAKRRHAHGERHGARTKPECLARGERNGQAKLTSDAAKQICEASGTHKVIAARFGVDKSLVSQIKRGLIWGHVTGRAA